MSYLPAVISILIAQSAGLIGAVFTSSSVRGWYPTLIKPSFNPPNWIFGPVWTTLYTLMGIASYLVWQQRGNVDVRLALSVYGAQLVLNALWSFIFFGLKDLSLAFAGIMVLLTLIVLTTVLFFRIHTWAGLLMLPYIAWVSFAAYLNYTLWQLN